MKRPIRIFPAVCGGVLALLVAVASAGTSAPAAAIYEVQGIFRSFDGQARQATISHDKIPGYMDAMTMAFDVRDPVELRGLQPGDTLAFHLCVCGDRAWIEDVRKTGRATGPLLVPAANPSRELNAGDLLPDIELVNQRGERIRLHDFHGQVLAVTFIYTRCPLPTYCPLMSRNFQAAQALLPRLVSGENWRFLSISLDAQNDSPDVLAAYARSWQADAQHWTFATASEDAVRTLGGGVGLEFKLSNGQVYHNLRTVVVDASGRIRHIFRGNIWTPQELVAEMRSAMRTQP